MDAAETGVAITVYSDYVCPFCFLGRESLDRFRADREEPLHVDWHPYDLRAAKRREDGTLDPDVNDGKDDAYYADVRGNVRRLQERYDVEMAREVATGVDSLPAQVASSYVKAAHPERWEAFDAAIFDALWRGGRDIGDLEVLAAVAERAELDPDAVLEATEDDANREKVRRKFVEAREAGVTGVPTFVYGDDVVRGAVPPEQLARLVDAGGGADRP